MSSSDLPPRRGQSPSTEDARCVSYIRAIAREDASLALGLEALRNRRPTQAQLRNLESRVFGAIGIGVADASQMASTPESTTISAGSGAAKTPPVERSLRATAIVKLAALVVAPAAVISALWISHEGMRGRSLPRGRAEDPSATRALLVSPMARNPLPLPIETECGSSCEQSPSVTPLERAALDLESAEAPERQSVAKSRTASVAPGKAPSARMQGPPDKRPKGAGRAGNGQSTDAEVAPGELSTPAPTGLAPPRSSPSEMGDDVDLVYRAQQQLHRGSPEKALRLVREYAILYPAGSMSEEAEAIGIFALVRLDRVPEAKTQARRFAAIHPKSCYLPNFRGAPLHLDAASASRDTEGNVR